MHSPIVSKNIRLRHPEHFTIGDGSIIDDFCYISTRLVVGRYSHIASGCSIAGGGARTFSLGDYSSLSSGVKIWCTSDDFVNDVVTIVPPGVPQFKENLIEGDVVCERLTAVGANSVVMPNNHLPEGTTIGALSFVPPNYPFEGWMVYAGTPIRPIRPRNRDAVLRQLAEFETSLENVKNE
jgi:acetyltransferase-like isoleucine patch superfamily enzyme